jgi:hypothetical protein
MIWGLITVLISTAELRFVNSWFEKKAVRSIFLNYKEEKSTSKLVLRKPHL